MDSKYKLHDFSKFDETIDEVIDLSNKYEYKRAYGVGRRTGSSAARNTLSKYEYIRTSKVMTMRDLYHQTMKVCYDIGVKDATLVFYYLRLQPDDFLDAQDYWINDFTTIARFLSISLGNDNFIEIDGDLVNVPKYCAIEFPPQAIHSIPKVSKQQSWLVLMVANYLKI